jgi:hypothetical protein
MSDRQPRITHDFNATYLTDATLEEIERFGVELRDGGPLMLSDWDEDDDGNPTWMVVKGIARFDRKRQEWEIEFTDEDIHWEPRES